MTMLMNFLRDFSQFLLIYGIGILLVKLLFQLPIAIYIRLSAKDRTYLVTSSDGDKFKVVVPPGLTQQQREEALAEAIEAYAVTHP